MVKCDFCGNRFEESRLKNGCKGCPSSGFCNKLKCPECGYEMLKEPGLIRLMRKWGILNGQKG